MPDELNADDSSTRDEASRDERQDRLDPTPADPVAPAFPEEREREREGNRGPDEMPGFGQGA
jgi:hypothetical protein